LVGNQNVRPLPYLIVLVALFAAGGSSCPRMMQQYAQPAPRVLPASPTIEQVTTVVNQNSARVTSYSAQGSLSGPGFPSLRTTVVFERPRRIRLRADTLLTGSEVDVGSNDDLFWIWVKRNQPSAVYFAHHDQFASTAAYQVMPVDPEWVIEGLGVPVFNPGEQLQGPFPLQGGRLEIRSIRPSPSGNLTKITVVDEARGWVLEQHLYDARGQRLASSVSSRHQYDPATGATLPRHVELQWPTAQIIFKLDLSDVQVNRIGPEAAALWVKPEYTGFPNVDLAQSGPMSQPPMAPQQMSAPQMAPQQQTYPQQAPYSQPPYAQPAPYPQQTQQFQPGSAPYSIPR
jgi:hypothetical protein